VGLQRALPYDKKKVPKAKKMKVSRRTVRSICLSLASKASTNVCRIVRQHRHYKNGGRLSSKVPEMTPGSPASEATKDAISKNQYDEPVDQV
jgi:hypothetical protein